MKNKSVSCAFTGHRPSKLPWGEDEADARCADLRRRIGDAVEETIRMGYRHFLCGMAEGCDLLFCEAVLSLRERYPEISIEAVLPCLSQSDGWTVCQRERYRGLLARCDEETLIQEKYSRGCMQRRNRYMVDHSSLLIAAHDGLPGGTRNTILHAFRSGISVIDVPIVKIG